MRGVTTKNKLFLVLLVLVMVCSYLFFYFTYNTYFTNLSEDSYLLKPVRLFSSRDAGEKKPSWWREIVCKNRNGIDDIGNQTKPLKQLFRNVTPEDNRNVFLMDTACNPTPKYRVWCSVESWARQNPDRQVWFLLTSGKLEGNTELTSSLLQKYTNLQAVTADLNDLFRDTPLMPLFNSRKWTKTWPVELLSDMLRVLVLWWWGGVYSDTDVISVRAFNLPSNSLGFEHAELLGSAVYSFQVRHRVLFKLMEDMRNNFQPERWGSIGPLAITRVMTTTCDNTMPALIRKAPITCPGNITLYPPSTFYPIRYSSFDYYFRPGEGNKFEETFGKAFALHFWNKMSKKHEIKVNSSSVYEMVAKKFCPVTYKFVTSISNVF